MLIESSLSFLQSDKLARNESVLEAGKSRQMALLLRNASQHTGAYFGSDVKVAYQLTNTILEYENKQQGFGLAATQDVHFTEVRGAAERQLETRRQAKRKRDPHGYRINQAY